MNQFMVRIAAFESDINMLKRYLDENTEARPIHDVEREVLALVQQTGRSMLAAYAARVGTGDAGTHLDEGREWRRHGIRKTYGFLCSKREAFERIVAEVAKRRVGRTKVLFLSDGDPDLTALAREFFPDAEHCVDWIHVVERLWTAAYLFFPEGSAQANAWVAKGKDLLISGTAGTVIRGLKQRLTKSKRLKVAQRESLAKVIGYLEGVRDRTPYDKFWAAGLPISTGSIEGACRHLVCDRMERAGMHWKEPGAQAMLHVRAVHINGEAKAFEAFRIAREQERLYGEKSRIVDLQQWRELTVKQPADLKQASYAASA